MRQQRLGGEDAAWLHMDDATNPMVVNGMLELAAPLPLESAYSILDRLAAIPRFRERVVEPVPGLALPSWEAVKDFELADHIDHVVLDSSEEDALRTFVGSAVSHQLRMDRPLWHVYVIDRPLAGTTILFRTHHSLADGFALLGVLLSLCDDSSVAHASTGAAIPVHRANAPGMLESAKALGRIVTLPPDRRTVLKGTLGVEKRVAWSRPLSLGSVKEAARAGFATVNDVLVATATGALGRYLERRGESTSGLELHAMIPVNLRPHTAPEALGNQFGLVLLGLPIGIADPLARVAAVHQRMEALKSSPEAAVTYGLLNAMGHAPRPIEDLAVSFFGKKTSLVLTNVPGPRAPLTLAGVRLSRIMFWVPQSGRLGLGLSIFSYAGEVTIGVICDAALLPDPEMLVADLHEEYGALEALVRAEAQGRRSRFATPP